MYKYTQLVRHIDKGIDRIDDPLLNRAWEIVKECIQAHVIVDREEGQTVRLARAEAWKEWVDAYQGEEETTCTFAGMVAEMIIACPDEEELDNLVAEAHALAQVYWFSVNRTLGLKNIVGETIGQAVTRCGASGDLLALAA